MVTAAPTRIHPPQARRRALPTAFLLAALLPVFVLAGITAGAVLWMVVWAVLPPLIGSVATAFACIVAGGAGLGALLWRWSR